VLCVRHSCCTVRACVRPCWPQPNKVNCPRFNTDHKHATAGHGSTGHGSVDAPCASVWGACIGLHWQPPAWTLNSMHHKSDSVNECAMALCVGRHWWRVISEAASASINARAECPTQHSKETCSLAGVGVCDAGGWVGEEGVGCNTFFGTGEAWRRPKTNTPMMAMSRLEKTTCSAPADATRGTVACPYVGPAAGWVGGWGAACA
jgi:hypothetical protein